MKRLGVGGCWRPTLIANAGTSDMRIFCERLLALVFALSVVCVAASAARADAYEDALAHFLADSFDDTIEGINALAQSGHPLAEKVIVALQDGRLLFSAEEKRVFFKDEGDRLFEATSGSPATGSPPADLSQVRLNNRLRRIIEATLGGLTLLAPDPAKRLEAAQAVFKSKDANALPALDQAIAKETNARVKRALSEARAAVILYLESAAETDKIDAVGVNRDDRKSTRLNSSHLGISYAVFCLKKKKMTPNVGRRTFPILSSLMVKMIYVSPFKLFRSSLEIPPR